MRAHDRLVATTYCSGQTLPSNWIELNSRLTNDMSIAQVSPTVPPLQASTPEIWRKHTSFRELRMSAPVIYVLGLPYSGSTLFSATLGTSPNVINLGEVNFLENDWHDNKLCSCRANINECKFWSRVALRLKSQEEHSSSTLNLSTAAELDAVDRRKTSISQTLALFFGVSLETIFGREHLSIYALKHEKFFNAVSEEFSADMLLDCSKTGPRLEALSKFSDVDLRVVHFRRNLSMIFASRLKRARKRNRLYSPALAFLYIGWLLHHLLSIKRTLHRIDGINLIEVDYEDFCAKPEATAVRLSRWLKKPIYPKVENGIVDLGCSHIYTGNIWLSKGGNSKTELRTPGLDPGLHGLEAAAMRAAVSLCTILGLAPRRQKEEKSV
jgi:hypothetical protein